MRPLPVLALLLSGACQSEEARLDHLAERYVTLTLALGRADPGYVDSYYGPRELEEAATELDVTAESLARDVAGLVARLQKLSTSDRGEALLLQARALHARAGRLAGEEMTFDEESLRYFGTVALPAGEAVVASSRERLEALLPGDGSLKERYAAHRAQFLIPEDRLRQVLIAALEACRARTREHLELPEGEHVELEMVRTLPWAAYHYYHGDFRSRIAVNVSAPVPLHQAVELMCHEAYPGHHTWVSLQDQELVRRRGWHELSVNALYTPRTLLAEGGASLGVGLVFPPAERLAFERDVLFPLAGLDPGGAERHAEVEDEIRRLASGSVETARRYLDGEWPRYRAAASLESLGMEPRPMLAFIDRYRSYVIAYTWGEQLVRERGRSWDTYRDLILEPPGLNDLTRPATPLSRE